MVLIEFFTIAIFPPSLVYFQDMAEDENFSDDNGEKASASKGSGEPEGSSSIVAVLSSMHENMQRNNELLRELMSSRKRSSLPDLAEPRSKRPKANQLASQQATSSDSEEEGTLQNVQAKRQQDVENPTEDDISLFGGDIDKDDGLLDSEHESNVADNDNDSLLDELKSALRSSDEAGPPVTVKLAELANESFSLDFPPEERKRLLKKFKRPSNCDQVFSPKVNEEIWCKLNTNAKRSDIRLYALQDTLVKATSAIISTTNGLLEHREKRTIPHYKDLITPLTDAVALLGHVNTELSFKRRETMKPFLNPEYRPLCARSRKPGKLLFGTDLPKALQELKTTNKIMNQSSHEAKAYKRNSTSRTGNSRYPPNRSTGSFLGNRGRGFYPPRVASANSSMSKKKFTKN